ncbi:MAG TPA: efflux RND transporter periplasmic adaptor subunit [candidate division Zixibacteria bacterium]|nr:efflux RND transporter periplasmic adaptor subunit [candidate division Zixibacteria bacterium]
MKMESSKPDLSSLRIDRGGEYKPPRKWWKWALTASVIPLLLLGYFLLMRSVTPGLTVHFGSATTITGSQAQALLTASGYVVAQRRAAVASKATGRLAYLGVVEGDRVKTGQVLARLENDDFAAELDRAKAALMQARAESTEAARFYERQKKLLAAGGISQLEFEGAEARHQRALAGMASARATVRVTEVALENTLIRAPFDGTVLTKSAEVGEMVAPLASAGSSRGAVVTLADMNSLEVEADVAEANIDRVRAGLPCEITLDAYPDTRYPGKVVKIVPTADRSRATVLVKVAFVSRDRRVLPEMSAKVNFLPEDTKLSAKNEKPVVAVPNSAVTLRNGVKMVFLVEGTNVKSAPVTTGRILGDLTEIKEGVNSGDRVVLSPPGSLTTGVKIKTSE